VKYEGFQISDDLDCSDDEGKNKNKKAKTTTEYSIYDSKKGGYKY